MSLQRPVFQIDGERDGSTGLVISGVGGVLDIVNVAGPGMVERGQWEFDQTSARSFTTDIAVELIIDGTTIFNEFLTVAETTLDELTDPPFDVDLTGANDVADFVLLRPISFKTSLVMRLRNDNALDATGTITGAMQWTKGV